MTGFGFSSFLGATLGGDKEGKRSSRSSNLSVAVEGGRGFSIVVAGFVSKGLLLSIGFFSVSIGFSTELDATAAAAEAGLVETGGGFGFVSTTAAAGFASSPKKSPESSSFTSDGRFRLMGALFLGFEARIRS